MIHLVPPENFASFTVEPQPDPPGWVDGAPTQRGGQSCAVCGTRTVEWVHPLARERRQFELWHKGHTLPSFWALCETCEDLYRAGAEESLVALKASEDASQLERESIALTLGVFRLADKGGRRFEEPPEQVLRLQGQGFEPLHSYTGVGDALGPVWPEEYRVELASEVEPDQDHRWMVRSPWPSVTLQDIFVLLWRWVERDWRPNQRFNAGAVFDEAGEVLRWPEDRATAWLATCRRADASD